MSSLRVDHLAFPSFDPVATHRFYTEVMGFPLVYALRGESAAWGGRYLLVAYAIPDGPYIEFVTLAHLKRSVEDCPPEDLRHIGLHLGARADLPSWRERLAAHGITSTEETCGQEVHLHFTDPNGVVLEVTTEADTTSMKMPAEAALIILNEWLDNDR